MTTIEKAGAAYRAAIDALVAQFRAAWELIPREAQGGVVATTIAATIAADHVERLDAAGVELIWSAIEIHCGGELSRARVVGELAGTVIALGLAGAGGPT